MKRMYAVIEKVSQLDRRVVYIIMALAVAIPFLTPFHFTAKPSVETLRFDKALDEAIAAPEPILVGVDYGPQTIAEMEPILLAIMHKLFYKKKKVIVLTFYPEASVLLRKYLNEMQEHYGLVYGRDYVYLGYAMSYYIAIYSMGTSIEKYFHEDDRGTPIREIELMRNVKKLNDLSAVVNVASNTLPHFWISQGVTPFNIDFMMACTAVQATDYFPYLQTGQVKGLIAGGRAGAEYEGLLMQQGVLDQPGDATRSLASQSMALLAIVGFVIIGNIGFLAMRLRGRGRSK